MNIEKCFTTYPDYEITVPTLKRMIPHRQTPSDLEMYTFMREIRSLNQKLQEQMSEIQQRLSALETYRERS